MKKLNIEENGITIAIEELFVINAEGKNYLVYTKNEKDEDENSTIYITEYIEKADSIELIGIEKEEYWVKIKDILRSIIKNIELGTSITISGFYKTNKNIILSNESKKIKTKSNDYETLKNYEKSVEEEAIVTELPILKEENQESEDDADGSSTSGASPIVELNNDTYSNNNTSDDEKEEKLNSFFNTSKIYTIPDDKVEIPKVENPVPVIEETKKAYEPDYSYKWISPEKEDNTYKSRIPNIVNNISANNQLEVFTDMYKKSKEGTYVNKVLSNGLKMIEKLENNEMILNSDLEKANKIIDNIDAKKNDYVRDKKDIEHTISIFSKIDLNNKENINDKSYIYSVNEEIANIRDSILKLGDIMKEIDAEINLLSDKKNEQNTYINDIKKDKEKNEASKKEICKKLTENIREAAEADKAVEEREKTNEKINSIVNKLSQTFIKEEKSEDFTSPFDIIKNLNNLNE